MDNVTINNKTVYTITSTNCRHDKPRVTVYTGTLEYLVNHVYGYTIESNGYDKYKVKSLATLLKYLNNGESYWSMYTTYEGRKATPEEIEKYKKSA